MPTITLKVHHGQVRETAQASGVTVTGALTALSRDRRLGAYAVKPENRYFAQVTQQLETTGHAAFGWGDYTRSHSSLVNRNS